MAASGCTHAAYGGGGVAVGGAGPDRQAAATL